MSVAYKIVDENGEVVENLPTDINVKGSATFMKFLEFAPQAESERICATLDTFISEFKKFQEALREPKQ